MTQPGNMQEQTEQLVRNGELIVFSKRSWLNRLAIVPFEIAFMLFSIFCGAGGLLHIGNTNTVFSLNLDGADFYNFLLIVAAVMILYGVVRRTCNVEAAGLAILTGQLLIRAIVLIPFAGPTTNSIVIFFLMALASLVRLVGVVTKIPRVEVSYDS